MLTVKIAHVIVWNCHNSPPPHNASLTLLKGVSECQNGGSDVAIKGLRDAWGGGAGVTSSFQ